MRTIGSFEYVRICPEKPDLESFIYISDYREVRRARIRCWLKISEDVHPWRGPQTGKRYRAPEWRMRPDSAR